MYGPDEYRYFTRRLGDVARELDAQREILNVTRGEMFNDEIVLTADAREHVRSASSAVAAALEALDKAVAALPAPPAPESAAGFRALHGGTL